MRPVFDSWHNLAPSRGIGARLVGDHPPWWAALLLQQTLQHALGRIGVAPRLDDLVKHVAILIDDSPQPVLLAGNSDHDLVQAPDVARAWLLAPEAAGVLRSELDRPATDGFIGNEDAVRAASPRRGVGSAETGGTAKQHERQSEVESDGARS